MGRVRASRGTSRVPYCDLPYYIVLYLVIRCDTYHRSTLQKSKAAVVPGVCEALITYLAQQVILEGKTVHREGAVGDSFLRVARKVHKREPFPRLWKSESVGEACHDNCGSELCLILE